VPGAKSSENEEYALDALRYGTTLFDFYQQNYFQALTELMTAQELQELGRHADQAQLLRGGMSLSFGMDRLAEEIFVDFLAQADESVDRDRAWFYLAKMAWQRGEKTRANEAIARISADYEGRLSDEAKFLQASISLGDGGRVFTQNAVDGFKRKSIWRYYLYYNLGASYAAQGEWANALEYYGKFSDAPQRSREFRSLRDRGLTAAGFAHMALGEFAPASASFKQVRLNSPFSNRALLGYGWSLTEAAEFHEALSPWVALSERSLLDKSVRESLLAIPYAYSQLDRPTLALEGYTEAADVYSKELVALAEILEEFRSAQLNELLGISDDDASAWLFDADLLPEGRFAPYLQHLVSKHAFQVALRELRDLHSVSAHLRSAQERLENLVNVDYEQQVVWSSLIEQDKRSALAQRQQSLQTATQQLRTQLNTALAQNSHRALATAQQRARWERYERALALAQQLPDSAAKLERLQFLHGLLQWEDSENYPAQAWTVKSELAQLEELQQESESALVALDTAISDRAQSDFSPRIASMQTRVVQQMDAVTASLIVAEEVVRQLAIEELQYQELQLAEALGHSRLAIARLYDQSSTGLDQ